MSELDFCTEYWRSLSALPVTLPALERGVDAHQYKFRSPRLVPSYAREKFRQWVDVDLKPMKATPVIGLLSLSQLPPATSVAELKRRYAAQYFAADGAQEAASSTSAAAALIKVLHKRAPLKDSVTLDDLRKTYGGGKMELGLMVMPSLEKMIASHRAKNSAAAAAAAAAPAGSAQKQSDMADVPQPQAGNSRPSSIGELSGSQQFWDSLTVTVAELTSDPALTDQVISKFKQALT